MPTGVGLRGKERGICRGGEKRRDEWRKPEGEVSEKAEFLKIVFFHVGDVIVSRSWINEEFLGANFPLWLLIYSIFMVFRHLIVVFQRSRLSTQTN